MDYVQYYINKKHQTVIDKPPTRIYVNKIKKIVLQFKLKRGTIFNF